MNPGEEAASTVQTRYGLRMRTQGKYLDLIHDETCAVGVLTLTEAESMTAALRGWLAHQESEHRFGVFEWSCDADGPQLLDALSVTSGLALYLPRGEATRRTLANRDRAARTRIRLTPEDIPVLIEALEANLWVLRFAVGSLS